MSHTPGPWTIGERRGQEVDINAFNGDPTIGHKIWRGLAIAYGSDDMPTEGKAVMMANARLITTSPDLLEFVRDVHAYLDALPNLPDNDELAAFADRAEALIKAVE